MDRGKSADFSVNKIEPDPCDKIPKLGAILDNFDVNFRQSDIQLSPKLDAQKIGDYLDTSKNSTGSKDAFKLLMSGGGGRPPGNLKLKRIRRKKDTLVDRLDKSQSKLDSFLSGFGRNK